MITKPYTSTYSYNALESYSQAVEKLDGISNNTTSDDPSNQLTEHFPDGSFRNWCFEKGNEHMTMYHKTGSSIQITPDGSMKFVSAAGQMGFECFGNGYMRVTGAHEVIVDGDASVKVGGNMDWTVEGDATMGVSGNFKMEAKSANFAIAETWDVGAENIKQAAGDSSLYTSTENSNFFGKGRVTLSCTGGDVDIKAAGDIDADATGNIELN